MGREHTTWIGAAALLLIIGLLIGWRFLASPDSADVGSFRQWSWESRSLDLLAQVGLIFARAQGSW